MKNQSLLVLSLLMLFASIQVQAQEPTVPLNEPNYNKPRLFNALPERLVIGSEKLQQLIATPSGESAKISYDNGQPSEIDGEVISQVSKYNQTLQSVVIRFDGFDGARLTLSKITLPDGTTKYTGRIISLQHGDLYQLNQEDAGWVLVKKNFYDLINE
jgi:hypothetical protein